MRIFPTKNGHGRSARQRRVTAEYQSDSSSKTACASSGAFSTSENTHKHGMKKTQPSELDRSFHISLDFADREPAQSGGQQVEVLDVRVRPEEVR